MGLHVTGSFLHASVQTVLVPSSIGMDPTLRDCNHHSWSRDRHLRSRWFRIPCIGSFVSSREAINLDNDTNVVCSQFGDRLGVNPHDVRISNRPVSKRLIHGFHGRSITQGLCRRFRGLSNNRICKRYDSCNRRPRKLTHSRPLLHASSNTIPRHHQSDKPAHSRQGY